MGHRINKIIGRKTFHVKDIRRSYRIRGRVARTQMNINETASVVKVMIRGDIIGPRE